MTTEQIEAMKALQVSYLEMREASTGREALAAAAKKKGFGTAEREAELLKQQEEMKTRHAKADTDYETRYGKKPSVCEETDLEEKTLTPADVRQKEKVVKGMKKKLADFKAKYGDRAKGVMYAAATKIAQKMPDVNEEVEELEELSKATLGSYVKKASDSGVHNARSAGVELGVGASKRKEKYNDYEDIASKRLKGISKAVDKLTKEEAELEEAMTPVESAVHAHNYNIYAREKGTDQETGKQLFSMGKAIQPVSGKDIPVGKEPEGYYRDKETGKILKSETPEETSTRTGQESDALTKAMGYGKGRYQGD